MSNKRRDSGLQIPYNALALLTRAALICSSILECLAADLVWTLSCGRLYPSSCKQIAPPSDPPESLRYLCSPNELQTAWLCTCHRDYSSTEWKLQRTVKNCQLMLGINMSLCDTFMVATKVFTQWAAQHFDSLIRGIFVQMWRSRHPTTIAQLATTNDCAIHLYRNFQSFFSILSMMEIL